MSVFKQKNLQPVLKSIRLTEKRQVKLPTLSIQLKANQKKPRFSPTYDRARRDLQEIITEKNRTALPLGDLLDGINDTVQQATQSVHDATKKRYAIDVSNIEININAQLDSWIDNEPILKL